LFIARAIFEQGATFLEVIVMRELHEKSGLNVKGKAAESFEFTEYVATARQNHLKERATQKSNRFVRAPRASRKMEKKVNHAA